MNKICTTIDQSKILLEFGFDINTADMCWSIDIPDLPTLLAYPITDCDNWENKIPAWSLTAFLDILPSGKALIHDKGNLGYKCICNNIDTYFHNNPVDACYEMVIKLKENGKL